ncbi:MerR family transcriptional regulator [Nocardia jinanensis]|uniref:MerR family transcriptional regulator n=1 Tax=Nocardia jinanensis TaxID=382504 RepID=A0A917RWT8_9NOCA|nr:MerR family transcriptional regulator [Nocardia jinanensis]GGL38295.1 MerR family transcriptional regulator [Nocardia jinanensis]
MNETAPARTDDNSELIGIGAAARRFGLAGSTLRYWEKRGLFRPAERRANWRRYGPDELHRIGLIQIWRDTGLLSLDEIAAVLTGDTGSHTWRQAVTERIEEIERQQERLAAAKAHLDHLLACPDDDPAANCPYLREMTAAQREPPA